MNANEQKLTMPPSRKRAGEGSGDADGMVPQPHGLAPATAADVPDVILYEPLLWEELFTLRAP